MTGNRFMWELHLRQLAFTYNACGPFTKHRERIQKFRETRNFKTYFAPDAAYSENKDLAKRTISDLGDRLYEIAIDLEYDGY